MNVTNAEEINLFLNSVAINYTLWSVSLKSELQKSKVLKNWPDF